MTESDMAIILVTLFHGIICNYHIFFFVLIINKSAVAIYISSLVN